MTPKFLGALTLWLLKGCKNNLFKDEWNTKNENRNLIVGYIICFLLVGLGILLVKYKMW